MALFKGLRRCRRVWGTLRGTDHMQGPQIHVSSREYGSSDYGNWTIAAGTLNADSIVYSVGVGEDVSFDLELIDTYNLTVHVFDPTPRSIEWFKKQQFPEQLVFHPVGIANFDGTAVFYPPKDPSHVSYSLAQHESQHHSASESLPVKRLKTIMEELGHNHIDLLKLDIEGAEYDVIQDLIDQQLSVRQILIEFHHRFPQIGIQKTRQAIASLNSAGYQIFFVSYMGEEISFLKIPG